MQIIVPGSNSNITINSPYDPTCPQLACTPYEPACGMTYCVPQQCGNSKAMPYSTKTVV